MAATDPAGAEGVLRFLTAGSVDDGKSTLIGRLLHDTRSILADQLAALERTASRRGEAVDLSLLTDGLIAEREQGITIDVAYRYFATARRKFIVADTPGHVQYTRNMVTAASTAALAILLVDVRQGVVEQTRRHAALMHLVGVPNIVVAVNKMDAVGYSREAFDGVVAQFGDVADALGLPPPVCVPLSALAGDMVVERGAHMGWHDGPTVLEVLETARVPAAAAGGPLRFPVQYVARPVGDHARRYLGRVESGTVAVGDRVVVLPAGLETRVASIRGVDAPLASAGLQAAVSITLADDVDVSRGDLVVHALDAPVASHTVDADLAWLGSARLDARRTYALRHTTREVRARVAQVHDRWNVRTQTREAAPDGLGPNDIGRVALTLAQPIAPDRYADNRATGSFILIDEATHDTIAAGMIR